MRAAISFQSSTTSALAVAGVATSQTISMTADIRKLFLPAAPLLEIPEVMGNSSAGWVPRCARRMSPTLVRSGPFQLFLLTAATR